METKTHKDWETVGRIKNGLIDRAKQEGAPVFTTTKTPRKAYNDLEISGANMLAWITSIENPADNTGHAAGRTVEVYLWEAARGIFSHGWRVATVEEVQAELDRQAKYKADLEQQERARITKKNRALIEAEALIAAKKAENDELERGIKLRRELAALEKGGK